MFKIIKMEKSNVISIWACDVVKKEEYKKLDPVVENKVRNFGKIRMLVNIGKLDGILLSAFWEDLKMSVKFKSNIEKVAIVGSNKVENIITKTIAPLILTEIKTFNKQELAEQWIYN